MDDQVRVGVPPVYAAIKAAALALNFDMASDLRTGSLLKTLIRSKPGGRFLELGTGTGLATTWMLAGMDEKSQLLSVDNNGIFLEVARRFITDPRVELLEKDGYEWILNYRGPKFDVIFADAMPGKYDLFEETLALLNQGGFYIIDDMLPQPNWPAGHAGKVASFIAKLESGPGLSITKMNWSTGIIIVVKS